MMAYNTNPYGDCCDWHENPKLFSAQHQTLDAMFFMVLELVTETV